VKEVKVEVVLSLCLIMHRILKFMVSLGKPPQICALDIAWSWVFSFMLCFTYGKRACNVHLAV